MPGTISHKNEEEFLRTRPRDGVHAIKVGTQWLDVIFNDRSSPMTLVAFHSAATSRIQKLPYFAGQGTAKALGWNLIAVSDPSLQLGDIDLAWFLGGRGTGPLRDRLSPVIRHLLGDTHPVLFGSSGGGYAAILYGQDFPDSTVIALNPRLDMGSRPEPAVQQYLSVCHQSARRLNMQAVRRKYVTENLGDLYEKGLPFDLHIIQNLGDQVYMSNQAQPFADRYANDPRFHFVTENVGRGHVGIPTAFLHDYLSSLNLPVSN